MTNEELVVAYQNATNSDEKQKYINQLYAQCEKLIMDVIMSDFRADDKDEYIYFDGAEAFMNAANTFDATKSAKFSTYLYSMIKTKFLENISRDPQKRYYALLNLAYRKFLEQGKIPTEKELIKEMRVSRKWYMFHRGMMNALSIYDNFYDGQGNPSDITIQDAIPSKDLPPDDQYIKNIEPEYIRSIIDDERTGMSEREKAAIKELYLTVKKNGKYQTQVEIASKWGISRQMFNIILQRAEEKLLKMLNREEYMYDKEEQRHATFNPD